VAAYRERFPKKKLDNACAVAGAKDGLAVIEDVRGPFDARAKELVDEQEREREAAEERMRELAQDHPIADTRDAVWSWVGSTSTSTFSSRGWSARRYAGQAAERKADDYREHGLAVKIVYVERGRSGGDFAGRAPTTRARPPRRHRRERAPPLGPRSEPARLLAVPPARGEARPRLPGKENPMKHVVRITRYHSWHGEQFIREHDAENTRWTNDRAEAHEFPSRAEAEKAIRSEHTRFGDAQAVPA
jgi:hypothetical protein